MCLLNAIPRTCKIVLFSMLFIGILNVPARAQLGFVTSLPELVSSSDAICVGTLVVKTTNTGTAYNVAVEQVIKGVIAGNKIDNSFGWDRLGIELHDGEHVLVFLDVSHEKTLRLLDATPGPVISLGSTLPEKIPHHLSPFRSVLLVMSKALPSASQEDQDQLLTRLVDIASSLKEDSTLEDFCRSEVLPSVRRCQDSENPLVEANTLRIAAIFQDIYVLPKLAEIAESGGNVSSSRSFAADNAIMGIAAFHDRRAVKQLLPLINSKVDDVRYAALSGLTNILGRESLPVLLDRLPRESWQNQNAIIMWLSRFTGEMKAQDNDLGERRQSKYVAFWRTWSKTHRAEIEELRTQLK